MLIAQQKPTYHSLCYASISNIIIERLCCAIPIHCSLLIYTQCTTSQTTRVFFSVSLCSMKAVEVESPCTTYHVHRVFKSAFFSCSVLSFYIPSDSTEGMFQFLFCRRISTNMCIRWKMRQ